MNVLTPYRGSINEIRIEGHTSSIWNKYTAASEAYFKNMSLSQGRTRSVLEYVYGLKSSQSYLQWIRSNIAAVGLSSSKLIFDKAQREDRARSQRVSFRVITNADIQIKNILEKANED